MLSRTAMPPAQSTPAATDRLALPGTPLAWDIFCNVIDNYGDIGVCWRLARQLAHEHGAMVRLWVDDLHSFARLCPTLDPFAASQPLGMIEVRHWQEPLPDSVPHDIVVEAFGCRLPDNFRAAMAARQPAPVWINLEYLSAESWIEGCHGLPSPDPQLPLTKYFYFPGFVANSGGLLRERGLLAAREQFQNNPAERTALLASYGLPDDGALLIPLFCYTNAALPGLLQAWADGDAALRCLVPTGVASAELTAFFGSDDLPVGRCLHRGNLEVRILPFVNQDDYDRLLWAADFCFVRGEDSFVRAQWAAQPFAWHIYPQEEDAHLLKLTAFLDRYLADLPDTDAAALRAFWLAWNAGDDAACQAGWRQLRPHLATLRRHARQWAGRQNAIDDLAASLTNFCARKIASQV